MFANNFADLHTWRLSAGSLPRAGTLMVLSERPVGSLAASAALPDGGSDRPETPGAERRKRFPHVRSLTAPPPQAAQIFFCFRISVAPLPPLKC